MSTLNLEETPVDQPTSKLPIILRTILMTILAIAIFASAGANGYFYFKYKETTVKLDTLQQDIAAIKEAVISANKVPKIGSVRSEVQDLNIKLDSIQSDIGDLQGDVGHIKRDVGDIEAM